MRPDPGISDPRRRPPAPDECKRDGGGSSPVAIVLPPREGFSPIDAGAVALQVRLLATPNDVVVGARATDAPFGGARFVAAAPSRWPGGSLGRYARGVAAALGPLRPSRIEVHNRPLVAAMLARRFPSVPVALHLHNDPQGMRGAATPADRARLGRRIAVAAVSAHLASRWSEGLGPSEAPAVLPNALALAALPAPLPDAARAPLVLFAGRLVHDKGADLFVDALAQVLTLLPGWQARMIGADRFSADSPETPFTRALAPRARAASIALDGFLPQPALLAAMARAAIVVVPSRWAEPFGMVALEALASGAALVATGRGGLAEVAGDAAWFVPPGDAAAIADAVLTLARDPARRAALAAAGRARAARFDVVDARRRLAAFRAATAR